jgi:hypothetical protein
MRARVTLPALLSIRPFQPSSLDWIRYMMKLKSDRFTCPWVKGKQMYLSRSLANFTGDSWANAFFKCLLTFLEVITLDLPKFTLRPDELQKLVRTSISECIYVFLALIKRRTSSLNKRCEMPTPFLETWIGCHTLSDTFLHIKQDSFSIHRTNKYRERITMSKPLVWRERR